MAACTFKRFGVSKEQLAEKLSLRCGELLIKYEPTFVCNSEAGNLTPDPGTCGNVFSITSAVFGEFPDFGFEVVVDGRENGGDLAQTVADELLAIAEGYMAVARRVAERLNRTPKRPKFRWEDLPVGPCAL